MLSNFSLVSIGKDPNSEYPYTRRTCGLFDGQKDNCEELIAKELKDNGENLTCHTCTKELCNESSFPSYNVWIVLLSVAAGVLLFKA